MLEIVNEERNRVKRIETYNRKQMETSRELHWIRYDKALL
jgi:hypothetical protein